MRNSKKLDSRPSKKQDCKIKAPPPLQLTQPLHTQIDEQWMLQSILSPTTSKLMQGFSDSQKKIISGEFSKMMKNLKKKLASPDKMGDKGMQSKTQRFQFADPNNSSKQTIKKLATTQRKLVSTKSPKKQTKLSSKQQSIKSPKKISVQQLQQYSHCRGSVMTSPSKSKKLTNSQIPNHKKSNKIIKNKPKKIKSIQNQQESHHKHRKSQDNINSNYFLLGESFVELDSYNFKEMESQIMLESSRMREYENQQINQNNSYVQQFQWKQFIEQKNKINTQTQKQSSEKLTNNNKKDNNTKLSDQNIDYIVVSKNSSECSSIIDRNFEKIKISPIKNQNDYNLNTSKKQLVNQFYDEINANKQIVYQRSDNTSNNAQNGLSRKQIENLLQSKSQQSQFYQQNQCPTTPLQLSTLLPQSSSLPSSYQQSLTLRQNAITLQFKTSKQILMQLLSNNKINKKQYDQYMDAVIQKYDIQTTELQKLKDIIHQNHTHVQRLVKIANQGLRLSEKINQQQVQVQDLINTIIGRNQNKKSQCGNLSNSNISQSSRQTSPSKSNPHRYQTHFHRSSHQPHIQNAGGQQIETFEKFQKDLSSSTAEPQQTNLVHSIHVKQQIQQRMAIQLGIIRPTEPIPASSDSGYISTSIMSVFSFIKSFYLFLKTYHMDEFLMYVNMPYGYSVEQRLKFMQGYDDDNLNQNKNINKNYEEQTQIMYGIEQVIRPSLLQQFYKLQGKDKRIAKGQSVSQIQRVHNRAILDGLNESLNQFRPYFHINGCPYPWTTTEKALTYYFIREDCCDELLEKVQIDVLKNCSSLCGLMIQQQHKQKIESNIDSKSTNEPFSIQQIFQKYTLDTDCELLQQRQQRVMKQQKLDINNKAFQWHFHDQFKTALLYEISSCVLQDLAHQMALFAKFNIQVNDMGDIMQLYEDCGVDITDSF